jgi:ribosomal protein S27E
MSKSKFIRVKCRCGKEKVVFSHSTHVVKCDGCKEVLVDTSGGEAVIRGEVLEVLG